MICPDCSRRMSIVRTMTSTEATTRVEQCECGSRYETVARIGRKLPADIPVQECAGLRSNAGKGTRGDLSGSDPDPLSDPPEKEITRSDPPEPAALSAAFELLWKETGRRGLKKKAHRAWVRAGRPTWEGVKETWTAYMRSEMPLKGYVQRLSTWLNGGGHQQEWQPAQLQLVNGAAAGEPPWKAAERLARQQREREVAEAERKAREIDAALAARRAAR